MEDSTRVGAYRDYVHRLMGGLLSRHELRDPIVDAGGSSHKAEMETTLGRSVETWDVQKGPDVDRVINLEKCPGIPNAYAGTIICTSVLEHTRRPWRVAEQLARIAQTDAILFVTAPWLFPLHAHPRDYWRFTLDGLASLFDEAFEEIRKATFAVIPREREGVWWLGRRR